MLRQGGCKWFPLFTGRHDGQTLHADVREGGEDGLHRHCQRSQSGTPRGGQSLKNLTCVSTGMCGISHINYATSMHMYFNWFGYRQQ